MTIAWEAMVEQWQWFGAAAAVLVVVIGLLILLRPDPSVSPILLVVPLTRMGLDWSYRLCRSTFSQVEETRIVESPGGVEHREIRWRKAALDEAKMVLVSYHAQRNLLMSPNYTVSAPTRTKQTTNGQAETPYARLTDESNGEGRVDIKPIAPEISS